MKKAHFRFYFTLAFVAVFGLTQGFSATSTKKTIALIKTTMGDIHVELFPNDAPETVKNFVGLAEGRKEFIDSKTGKKLKKPFYDGLIFHRVLAKFMIQGGCPLGKGTGSPGYKFANEINGVSLGLDKQKVVVNGQFNRLLGRPGGLRFMRALMAPIYKKLNITNKTEADAQKTEVTAILKKMSMLDVYKNMGYVFNTTRQSHAPKRGSLAMANAGPNSNGSQFFINVIDTPWLTGKHTVFGQVIKGMDIVDKISKAAVTGGGKPVTEIKIISIRLMK